jgi:hypothetical protein
MERFFARTLKGRQDDRKTEPQGTTAIGRKQPNRKPTARQQRPGDREPSWLMPPVKGPNLFYRTIATREGRCVEGFSMGGSGAAKWGFKYPEHLGKLGLEHEFHIIPESPHTPNPLYDGLGDKNWAFFRAAFASSGNLSK